MDVVCGNRYFFNNEDAGTNLAAVPNHVAIRLFTAEPCAANHGYLRDFLLILNYCRNEGFG